MKNPIPNITDEMGEFLKDAGKGVVREVKDMGKIAKAQITGQQPSQDSKALDEKKSSDPIQDKKDPITGKKPPTKQQLSDLKNQAAQLQMAKLKKIREELEAQRLKVTDQKAELAPAESAKKQGQGPKVQSTESAEKAPDNAVANTLKGSKSTGEFKGLVGG